MVAQAQRSALRQRFPLLQRVFVAVIDFLEAQLFGQDVGKMPKDEVVAQSFGMKERVDGGKIFAEAALARAPAEAWRLVSRPIIAGPITPNPKPFVSRVVAVGVGRGDDQILDEIVAEKVCGGVRWIVAEPLAHAGDLIR